MPDSIVTTEEVTKPLHSLMPSKAAGPNAILARIIQLAANKWTPALRIIILQNFLSQMTQPNELQKYNSNLQANFVLDL